MEFSVREWTIIVGVLLIVAVFLDGYRRVRNERSNRIRVSLSKQVFNRPVSTQPIVEESNPELPAGGARVIAKRRSDDLKLHQNVPVLIEPVTLAPEPQQEQKPVVAEQEPESKVDAELLPTIAADVIESASEPIVEAELDEPSFSAEDDFAMEEPEPVKTTSHVKPKASSSWNIKTNRNNKSGVEPEREISLPQEVLVVNVLAKGDVGFKGPDLLQLLLACDLRFGDMNIFHRYEKANGKGPIQFSVANLVEPGSFNLDDIDDFNTPGVSFFLTLPGPEKPVTAFNYMVETAQVLVRHLQAELRDDAHSVMTAQTIEHCRQRIRDFERKQLTLQL
jgi:cell division protein ZipA